MPERVRNKTETIPGTELDPLKRVKSSTFTSKTETCTDFVQPGDNHPLVVSKRNRSGGLMNGSTTSWTWVNYPCAGLSGSTTYSHLSLPSYNTSALVTGALKRSMPERPSVDLVVSLLELREIPSLIKDSWLIGKGRMDKFISNKAFRALKIGAKLNLMAQFGLLPLIGDVEKLLIFQKLVDSRVKELKKLQERGVRRSLLMQSDSNRETTNRTVQSVGFTHTVPVSKITTRDIRVHVRWHVQENFYSSDTELRELAKSIVRNNRLDPAALYELLPWSWLVDYFTNLGDFVALSRNRLNVTHDVPSVIIKTRTETTFNGTTRSYSGGRKVVMENYVAHLEDLNRFQHSGSLTALTDFLTDRQTSILASLAIAKVK